ncbi:hypothetical protein BASA50_008864 [Batrachochytrium salamandrivorans]|uniref:Uncharacterized protein n=1 Tax=Batrachochytrium salamandrivorans TaxID=1357716 RepID=A0ABQ8F2Y8_9FUNG|nr:hypothetical protein BASA60_009414 [Batrachochytrium salamandrivorans]KAH6567531.1 hypothetical protein BASA62_006064 [Batrachochytrium salamandrivorans]KAH6591201.1 hypothetical protein BASA50_008864 [Batrachochytrium salamandrivorans]KAH9245234.1 hypothetical protein BASA81_017284 [Batrachochytrium salamandrivorans]
MKLISFAVISLLTITVSAQILPGTSAAKYALQSDQNVIHDKIRELTTIEQEQEKLVLELGKSANVERWEKKARLVMERLVKVLKDDSLSEVDKSKVKQLHADAAEDWSEANAALVAKKKELKEATKQLDCMKMKIFILNENIELQLEQDARSKGPIEASPGSNPHREILEEQADEAYQDFSDLSDVNKNIREGLSKLDSVIDRTEDPKKELELLDTWNKFRIPSNKLLDETKLVKCKCIHAREFQTELGWQSLSSQVWGAFKSFLLGS